MQGKVEEVLKAIPDFEDFMKLSEEISKLMYKKMSLESEIKELESAVFRKVTKDTDFFQNGRPPSMSYIEQTYKYTGLSNELMPVRDDLAKVVSELERKKLQMDIYKSMIEVWRTLSSNQRSASV